MNPDVQRLSELADLAGNGGQNSDQRGTPRLADVLDTIEQMIVRYVLLPTPGLATLTATWIAGTYCYEAFQAYGYLALRSATPRCGKTRLLRLISLFANGTPPITTTPTAAVLFRSNRKVLLLDEVDRLKNSDKETFGDVLAVLNTGFERGGIVERVERTKGGEWQVKEFPTYGPKALAGIESLADTLADRAFMIQMERTPSRMPRLNVRLLNDTAIDLRLQMEQWAALHGKDVESAYDALPDEVDVLRGFDDDRLQDISEPLVVLASIFDAERPEGRPILPRLLDGLRAAAGQREPSGRERELLAFLQVVEPRIDGRSEVFLKTQDLVSACQDREELSRIETGRALAGFLKHFDLRPGFNPPKTERGYTITAEWVENWRIRYGRKEAE